MEANKQRLKQIGEKLRTLRTEKGYVSAEFFAWEHKLPRATYTRLEAGSYFNISSLIQGAGRPRHFPRRVLQGYGIIRTSLYIKKEAAPWVRPLLLNTLRYLTPLPGRWHLPNHRNFGRQSVPAVGRTHCPYRAGRLQPRPQTVCKP